MAQLAAPGEEICLVRCSILRFRFGVPLPGKTPREIFERLDRGIVKALELPEVKDRIAELGGEPTSLTPMESTLVSSRRSRPMR